MDFILFENKNAQLVGVHARNHLDEEDTKGLNLLEGNCLKNSLDIAEIKKCFMVEGFLVTKYKDKPLECVGHVWNEIGGEYVDYTINLKQHDEQIESHSYYAIVSYYFTQRKVEIKIKEDFDIRTQTPIYRRQEWLSFKTTAKEKELEVREYLRRLSV